MSAKLFKEFRDALAIKNSEEISGRYKAITARLNKDYWDIDSDVTNCLQVGSYGRSTAINGVSDLDMAFELPWAVYDRFNKRTGNVQSQLLQEVKQCLEVRYPTTTIRADSQVVVLEFKSYRVEVLPAFKAEDGGYTFPDSNDGGSWKKCWPRDEMDAVTEVNNRANRNLKHVCKMLRSWKNEHGAPMGGLLIDTGRFWTVDTMYWSKVLPAANGKFAYYAATTIPFDYYSTSTALPSMTKGVLNAHLLAVPSLSEQTAIATFLDSETGKIGALIAEQEKLLALLAEKRQATISHAVTKGLNPDAPMKDSGVAWLGKVPEHWDMKRIKDCGCEVVDCKNRTPKPHPDGDYFVVRTSCVKDGRFDPEPGYRTDERNFIEWTAKGKPQTGDVLFTREAPTGEACLAPQGLDFCLGQRMMYIRPPEQVLRSEFLLYSIYGGLARERISEKSKGSTVGHLRVGEVGELPLLLPPLDEQRELVDFVADELNKLQSLEVESERAIALLKERRSALIAAAVTGQIDVRGLVTEPEAA